MYVPLYGWGLWLCVCGGCGGYMYLRIKLLEHITSAMIKSRDGVKTPEASNSNSQCCPVNPIGHKHSYRFGGLWSLHRPPLWHGSHMHSFSLTQWLPDILNPAGHLRASLCMCACHFCVLLFFCILFFCISARTSQQFRTYIKKGSKNYVKKPTKNKLLFVINQSQKLNKSSLIILGCAVAYIFATAKHYKNKNRNYWNYNLYSNTTSSCVVVLEQL